MKRAWILVTLLNIALLAAANPFLGRWDCTEVDDMRLSMTFGSDMKVRIERKQPADVQEVGYEVHPENLRLLINGSLFHYLFTDDDHFILFPNMSEFIKPGTSRDIIRVLLLDMSRSHSLYTARRAR